jgi:4-amino-4-deoxy-L-arabinose transferase-like glycosyltransferase
MTQHAMPFAPAAGAVTEAVQELPARLGKFADRPRLIVTLACLLLLLPFLSKPLHIDDPMYVWAAENILARPLDPYGFAVNWRSTLTPMAQEMKNPPLVCYYLAGAIMVLGRSEQSLHLAMLLPAVGVVLGTYQLAKLLGSRPLLASATVLATPVFLLSATTIMCDVAMVCAYVWAVWFWVAGIKRDRMWMLAVGAGLIAVSTLTKYFGVTLFPLLIAYGFMVKRRPGTWLLSLLMPVAILIAYHLWTKGLYGHGLLMDAAGFAARERWSASGKVLAAMITGFAFTGGCCVAIVLLGGIVAPRTTAIAACVAFLVTALLLMMFDPIVDHSVRHRGAVRWWFVVQLAFWSACGFAMLSVLVRHVWSERTSADCVLLGAWILGTLCFAVFVNWNVAARSILPIAPAAAILVARMWTRRLESDDAPTESTWRPWIALAPACGLALLICAADASLARTQLDAANQITDALAANDESGGTRTVYFAGHWGFQHYMERAGAKPIDKQRTTLRAGDVVILPDNNTQLIARPAAAAARVAATLRLAPMPLVSTMRPHTDAGFYSDVWGPLPFAFGPVPEETYRVVVVERPLSEPPPTPRK